MRGLKVFLISLVICLPSTWAAKKNPIHWSGDMRWDRKNNLVELIGNGRVSKEGETLEADYVLLDLKNDTIHAKGNCVYKSQSTVVRSNEIHFSLDMTSGSIIDGTLSDGKFLLTGERINKLGEGKFQTHKAEYTTCLDCPASWAFQGEDVEMEVDGYAYMSNVRVKIKDSPVMWFPYLVIPIKTRRQTGFLFPQFGFDQDRGFKYIQRFFWATSRSTDMSFNAGTYTERGFRGEWEGRYKLGKRSEGKANFFYQRDKYYKEALAEATESPPVPNPNRWGFELTQKQILPWNIDEKLKVRAVGDSWYPMDFSGDVSGNGEPSLKSQLLLSKTTPGLSAFATAKVYRTIINRDRVNRFDTRTVQVLPQVEATANNQVIADSPFSAGLTLGATNFTRFEGSYDRDPCAGDGIPGPDGNTISKYCLDENDGADFQAGIDPIRKAVRAYATPTIYGNFRPWDRFSFVPSLEYRSFFYKFDDDKNLFEPAQKNLVRGYLLAQADFSFQLEKVYETENPEIPRVKHLVRPHLTYSVIPTINEQEKHPFSQQIQHRSEYRFDNYDIVPKNTSQSLVNYFTPLGNSLSYGFTTQVVRRHGAVKNTDASYHRMFEFKAQQTFNFIELRKKEKNQRIPFTRLETETRLNLEGFEWSVGYNYYPFLTRYDVQRGKTESEMSPHEVTSSIRYIIDQEIRDEILKYDRSVSANYSWRRLEGSKTSQLNTTVAYSLNNYFLPTVTVSYDFETHRFTSASSNFLFQSPSRCWRFNLGLSKSIGAAVQYSTLFELNLTGEGFGGFDQLESAAAGS